MPHRVSRYLAVLLLAAPLGVLPAGAKAPAVAPAPPADHLLLLRHLGEGRCQLQELRLPSRGAPVCLSQVALPAGFAFTGPASISLASAIVIGNAGQGDPITVYEWRRGREDVLPLTGAVSAFRRGGVGWSVAPTSYAAPSRRFLITQAAPEGLADEPLVWSLGTERAVPLRAAYPALHLTARDQVTAACFSPDGALLAVAVQRLGRRPRTSLLVYDLTRGRLRRFAGPTQYVWMLALSPHKEALFWVDTGRARALAAFETSHRTVSLGRYEDTGCGLLSLRTGRHTYRRLSADPSFARAWARAGAVLTDQYRSTATFSTDSRRVYLLFAQPMRLDLRSHQWSRPLPEATGAVAGLTLLRPTQ